MPDARKARKGNRLTTSGGQEELSSPRYGLVLYGTTPLSVGAEMASRMDATVLRIVGQIDRMAEATRPLVEAQARLAARTEHKFRPAIELAQRIAAREAKRSARTRRRLYHETKSPLFVWEAIDEAMTTGEPIPDWANEYLADSAQKLLACAEDGVASRDDQLRALGLASTTGMTSPVRAYKEARNSLKIANEVSAFVGFGVETRQEIVEEFAKQLGLSERTVERHYDKFRKDSRPAEDT